MFVKYFDKKTFSAFLSLAYLAMQADRVEDDSEKAIIESLIKESGISASHELSYDEAICVFKSQEIQIKRMAYIELIGILFADGKIDFGEVPFAEKCAKDFELDFSDMQKAFAIAKKQRFIVAQMANYVRGQ